MLLAEAKIRHSAEFLRCIRELDVDGILRLHTTCFPPDTAPSSRVEALASLHMARTSVEGLPRHLRRYSQRWLNERGLGSEFKDHTDRRERQ